MVSTWRDLPVDGVQCCGGERGQHGAGHGGRAVRILQRNALDNAPSTDVGCARRKEEARQQALHLGPLLYLGLHLQALCCSADCLPHCVLLRY